MSRKKIIVSSSIYSAGAFLQQFIVLFFVKINTKILSQEEYGQYSLLKTVQGIIVVIITLSLQAGFTRFYREFESATDLKNTVLNFTFCWSILLIVTIYLLKGFFINLIFPNNVNASLFLMIIVISIAINALNSIYKVDYKMKYKAKTVISIDLGIITLNLILLVIFGIYFKMKILGILLANLLSVSITFIVLFLINIKNFKIKINKNQLKPMLLYSIGLLMGQMSSWILTFIDRFYLKKYYDFATVGVYSVGYKIGFMIRALFTVPFTQVFTPYKFQIYKEKNAQLKFQQAFRYYNVLGWLVIFIFAVFSRFAILVLTNSEYLQAYKIVPLVSISYFIFTLTVFYGFGLHVVNKMLLNSFIITLGAIFNIGLNILLIPPFGMQGAAFATILSYVLVNIMYYFIGNKYWDTGISLLGPYKIVPIFVIWYFIYDNIIKLELFIVAEFFVSVVIFISFVVTLRIFKFITEEDVKLIRKKVTKFLKKTIEKNSRPK